MLIDPRDADEFAAGEPGGRGEHHREQAWKGAEAHAVRQVRAFRLLHRFPQGGYCMARRARISRPCSTLKRHQVQKDGSCEIVDNKQQQFLWSLARALSVASGVLRISD